MPKYYIQTYGCQMNYSDSERMEHYLEALGYEKAQKREDADLIIFNTCSVRQRAEDRIFGEMNNVEKAKKKKKNLLSLITGCMVRKSSSRYSEKRDKLFRRAPGLDIALRIEELPKLAGLIKEINPDIEISEIPEEKLEDYFEINANYSSNAQAFIPISTGCDKFCTYCIVPYSRGREKSRKIEDILKEAEDLVKNGCKQITLLGQTVDSYGLSKHDEEVGYFKDLPKGEVPFVYLLKQLDKLHEKGLQRLRFTSPHPRDISDQLIDAIAELKTLQPYLHLPVQSGNNAVLKRMNRPYTVEDYKKIIKKLRKKVPGIAISTDIIVGFCGETEEEFKETCDFFEEIGFDHAYHAMYSNRPGTVASKFMKDDVPYETKKKRWRKFNEIIKKSSQNKLENYLGKTINVLVDKCEAGFCSGRCEHYKDVRFPSKKDLTGQIVPVKVAKAGPWILQCELNDKTGK